MEIKSHLFEIMQLCFLHSILFFFTLSSSAETFCSQQQQQQQQQIKVYPVFSRTVTYLLRSGAHTPSSQLRVTEILLSSAPYLRGHDGTDTVHVQDCGGGRTLGLER